MHAKREDHKMQTLPCAISVLFNLLFKFACSEDKFGRLIHDYSLQTHISKSLWLPERHKRSLESLNRTEIMCPRHDLNGSCTCYRDYNINNDSIACCGTLLSAQEANSTSALDVHNLALEKVTSDVITDVMHAITSSITSYCKNKCYDDLFNNVTYRVTIIALDPLRGTTNNQPYLRVLFLAHVIYHEDVMTSLNKPFEVMSQSDVQDALASEMDVIQSVLGYNVTIADNRISWSCDGVKTKKGFTRKEMAGIVIGGMCLTGIVLAYCCSIKKAIVQRSAIKRRIKERRLARLEQMKKNDTTPLTPEEESRDSASIVVTQIPGNNNQIKVKATVHSDHANGDVIMNGVANGHVANGSIPNGHVGNHLQMEEEVNKEECLLHDMIGEELQDIRVDGDPPNISVDKNPLTDSDQIADDTEHSDRSNTNSGYNHNEVSPISELPEVQADDDVITSNGHVTNGIILQARRLSRHLKHSMSEQEASLATSVANVMNMRNLFNKTRRIKSEELVSSNDFINRDVVGIDNHALT